MARRSERLSELRWPFGGLDEGASYFHQRQAGRERHGTYVDGENVRGFDPASDRMRGSSRSGFSKFIDAQVNGAKRIQNINHVVSLVGTSSGTTINSRTLKVVVVSDGTVVSAEPGDSSYTAVTNGSGALQTIANAPFIMSTPLFSKLYFADGTNHKAYDPSTDTISSMTASAGSLPVDNSNAPRLITSWRGRLMWSGIKSDPHNYFASKIGDPTNYDYTEICAEGAFAGNNVEQIGKCPDVINAMVSLSNENFLFLCDHSIYRIYGDPRNGGRMLQVSDRIGAPFGQPWCRDTQGAVYFLGIPGAIYRIVAGGLPEKISSQRLEKALREINVSTKAVRLEWDEDEQGCHIFLTPLTAGATKHYFYELRNDAFHRDSFADNDMNPVASHVVDGDAADDRVLLIGSEDGYVRFKDRTAKGDDGEAISSYIYLGPIQSRGYGRLMLKELQAVFSSGSDAVAWELFSGQTAEEAFESESPRRSGQWSAGRNRPELLRIPGHALYLKISNSTLGKAWSVEHIHSFAETLGSTAQRGM